MKKLKCKKCGHEWVKRVDRRPKQCPSCTSRIWDTWKPKPKGK